MDFKRKMKLGIFMVTGSLALGLVTAPSVNQLYRRLGNNVSVVSEPATAVTVKALKLKTSTTKSRQTQSTVTQTSSQQARTRTDVRPKCLPVAVTKPRQQKLQTQSVKPVNVDTMASSRAPQASQPQPVAVRVNHQPAQLGPAVKN